jgi:hypothetical protein
MTKKPKHYNQVLKLLQQLQTSYPDYNMGRHLSTALADYGDFWGISDRELLFALTKYKSQIDMDFPHLEGDIDDIIKEAQNLETILKEEENGDD